MKLNAKNILIVELILPIIFTLMIVFFPFYDFYFHVNTVVNVFAIILAVLEVALYLFECSYRKTFDLKTNSIRGIYLLVGIILVVVFSIDLGSEFTTTLLWIFLVANFLFVLVELIYVLIYGEKYFAKEKE